MPFFISNWVRLGRGWQWKDSVTQKYLSAQSFVVLFFVLFNLSDNLIKPVFPRLFKFVPIIVFRVSGTLTRIRRIVKYACESYGFFVFFFP